MLLCSLFMLSHDCICTRSNRQADEWRFHWKSIQSDGAVNKGRCFHWSISTINTFTGGKTSATVSSPAPTLEAGEVSNTQTCSEKTWELSFSCWVLLLWFKAGASMSSYRSRWALNYPVNVVCTALGVVLLTLNLSELQMTQHPLYDVARTV